MTSYLLDTHVLIWWLGASPRMPRSVRDVIADPGNTIWVSAAAIWEMAVKKTLGRLDYPPDLISVLATEAIRVLPVQAVHALAVADLPLLHQDPFDRLQIAQATLEGLTLVTHDQLIRRYDVAILSF